MEGISTLFKQGGVTLYVLFLLSIILVAIVLERAYTYRRFRRALFAFLADFKEKSRKNKQVAGFFPDPSSPLVHLQFSNPDREENEKRVELNISRVSLYLDRNLPFLATIGSIAPFIGLFGTVLGIMRSFHAISVYRSAGIAVVGAGIAEALVCTAAGLGVAIVAVTFYNIFRSQTAKMVEQLEIEQNEMLLSLKGEEG